MTRPNGKQIVIEVNQYRGLSDKVLIKKYVELEKLVSVNDFVLVSQRTELENEMDDIDKELKRRYPT